MRLHLGRGVVRSGRRPSPETWTICRSGPVPRDDDDWPPPRSPPHAWDADARRPEALLPLTRRTRTTAVSNWQPPSVLSQEQRAEAAKAAGRFGEKSASSHFVSAYFALPCELPQRPRSILSLDSSQILFSRTPQSSSVVPSPSVLSSQSWW